MQAKKLAALKADLAAKRAFIRPGNHGSLTLAARRDIKRLEREIRAAQAVAA